MRLRVLLLLAVLLILYSAYLVFAQPSPPVVVGPGQTFPLTVTKTGSGTGTVEGPGIQCGTNCDQVLNAGSSATLTVIPAQGSQFSGWGGACSGIGTCTVIMNGTQTVTASFSIVAVNALNLAWDHDGLNLTNFSLERRTPCTTGVFGIIAPSIASGLRAYSDTTVAVGTPYEYRIQAANAGLFSGYSNLLCSGSTNIIAQTGWSLLFVDSQDVQFASAYAAINSFDGNPATIWHTQWSTPPVPSPPHEIQIDLGAVYNLTGFRYLPRNDGSLNGNIGQYELYVSNSSSSWGSAVTTGSFVNDNTEKQVLFPAVSGRCVRLRALTEAAGQPWTSMAELNLIGAFVSVGVSCTGGTPPNTVVAAGCSQQQILDAVNQVPVGVAGWTVQVPAQNCTWTGTITINKGITLQGAGIDQTVINDGRVRSGSNGNILTVNIPTGGIFRMTGMSWYGDGVQAQATDGMIIASGCSTSTATNGNYRFDNNKFSFVNNIAIKIFGSLYGVSDHNTIVNGLTFVEPWNQSWSVGGAACAGSFGDSSWADALTPGTIKAHYIETNTYTNTGAGSFLAGIVDSHAGSRIVVRNNVMTNAAFGSHGTDSGQRLRGVRWMEIYGNTVTFLNGIVGQEFGVDFMGWQRGGTGVWYNNAVTVNTTVGFSSLVKHANLRDTGPWSPWGQCDGTKVFDGNTAGQTGYRCLDQPGAGTSVDYANQGSDTDVSMLGPAGNTSEPIYVWNNTVNGVLNNCGNIGCGSEGHVVAARDIIFGTGAAPQASSARPGYTPLAYPHPLVTP